MYCSHCGERKREFESYRQPGGLSLEAQTRPLIQPARTARLPAARGGRQDLGRVLTLWLVLLISNITTLLLVRRLARTDSAVIRLAGEINISIYTISYLVGLVIFALWASYAVGRWAGVIPKGDADRREDRAPDAGT